jgi:hypothetical protein
LDADHAEEALIVGHGRKRKERTSENPGNQRSTTRRLTCETKRRTNTIFGGNSRTWAGKGKKRAVASGIISEYTDQSSQSNGRQSE